MSKLIQYCVIHFHVYFDNTRFDFIAEAAAIHCMSILKEHGLLTGAAKYLIVDCNNEEKRRKFNRRLY
ncbi:hypothetical protein RhiirA4_461970 [Rhizophagus irregularis]|uniref:Uncharacterized protein n=1 Tax=Rhizophagus irregularis TaxID=588596 RepID=A0A2I1GJX8_9GLOM|nr:hypothetical protein RhiirA4_461970 [Rhizophagus irregularis]